MLPRTLFAMLACAAVGWLLGRTRGMGLQGFFFGLAFGPLGWGLILLWPRSWVQGPVPRGPEPGGPFTGTRRPDPFARPTGQARPDGRASGGCPRCGEPAPRDAAACPRCGNVLVPIHYQVEDGP